MSVGNLSRVGIRVCFDINNPHLRWGRRRYNLICVNNLFYWPMKLREDDQETSTSLRKYCEACGAKLYNNQTCPYPTCSSHTQAKSSSTRPSPQQAMNKTPDNKRQQQISYSGDILAGEGQSKSTKDIMSKQFPRQRHKEVET